MGGRVLCVWGDVDTQERRCAIDDELEDGVRVCVCNFCAEFKEASKGWVAASNSSTDTQLTILPDLLDHEYPDWQKRAQKKNANGKLKRIMVGGSYLDLIQACDFLWN